MKDKDTPMHNNPDVLADMMASVPKDMPISENGHKENIPPIHTEEINILETMLGSSEFAKTAIALTKDKPKDTNFSNMSLSGSDVDYIKKYFNHYRVKLSDDIPQPISVIKLGGRSIATVADMTTITGKAKARKSYFLSAVLTAALNPSYYNGTLEVNLPEERNNIIWIDTEQSEFWSQQILKRVMRSGVSEKAVDERIIYLNCRDLSVSQVKAITYVALENHAKKSSMCIIDGSRDLVNSVNNEDEAAQLSRWLPEMAKKYNCNITSVLHQNPSGSSESKLRGHLGTELMNKSEFVVEIKKHPKDKDVFIASSMLSRDIGTDDLCFMINDGLLEFVGEPVDTKSEKSKFMYDFSIANLKEITRKIFITKISYNQRNLSMAIQTYIKESHELHIGHQKIVNEWIPYLENKGLIEIDHDSPSKNGLAKFYKKAAFADTETSVPDREEIPQVVDDHELPF